MLLILSDTNGANPVLTELRSKEPGLCGSGDVELAALEGRLVRERETFSAIMLTELADRNIVGVCSNYSAKPKKMGKQMNC